MATERSKRIGSVGLAATAVLASGCLFDGGTVADRWVSTTFSLQATASSDDGRYVAFASSASNLVPGDTDGSGIDVFVRDVETGTIERITSGHEGSVPNDSRDWMPTISDDGRYVAFIGPSASQADGAWVHDRTLGTTTRVDTRWDGSHSVGGAASVAISGDGQWVAFDTWDDQILEPLGDGSPAAGRDQIYRRHRTGGPPELVTPGHDGSFADAASAHPSISDDGSVVAFESAATNLVPNDTNGGSDNWEYAGDTDVFVSQMPGAAVSRASVSTAGLEGFGNSRGARVSGNGQFVTFESEAGELIAESVPGPWTAMIHDLTNGATSGLGPDPGAVGTLGWPSPTISDDGRFVVASTSGPLDPADPPGGGIYAFDRHTGDATLTNTDQLGNELGHWGGHLSGDGKTVQFLEGSNFALRYRTTFPPAVTATNPSSIDPGATETVTITGTHLDTDVDVAVSGGGVTIDGVTRISETQLDVQITVDGGATPGDRVLTVEDPGLASASRAFATLTIQATG